MNRSIPFRPSYFPLYERETEDLNQEVISSSAQFYISEKCITLIKSIEEGSKRETREKWGYWVEVLNKWTSPRSDVQRSVGCSGGTKVQLPQWRAEYLSSGNVLLLFPRVGRYRKYIKAYNHNITSDLHNALDSLYTISF